MSGVASATTVWTAEMLERLPDDGRRREIIRGELIEMAPANLFHALIVGYISSPMIVHVRQRRLGNVYVGDPGFQLEYERDTVLAPDIAFVRAARVPQIGLAGFAKGFPDLVVEVLSPSNTASEMFEKIEIYLKCGVTALWIVDPKYKSAEIHRNGQPVLRLGLEDALEDADLLPGLRLPLRDLFGSD